MPASIDRVYWIRNVHDVTIAYARNAAKGQVFHILDVHRVSWGMYAASVGAVDPSALAYHNDAVREQYERDMRDVKEIQEQHESVIRDLVRCLNIRSVYVEGLHADDPAVGDFLAAVRSGEQSLQMAAKANVRLRKYLDKEFGKPRDFFGPARIANYTRLFKTKYGASAALFVSGELADIKPVEDSRAARDASIMMPDGRLYTSGDAMELREDAMVRNMLKGQMPALIILGAAHDLDNNIRRVSGDYCDYIRIQSERCCAKRSAIEARSHKSPLKAEGETAQ